MAISEKTLDRFPENLQLYDAYERAWEEAMRVVQSDMWAYDGPEHRANLLRWVRHGGHEARIALLYYTRYPGDLDPTFALQDVLLGLLLHDIGKVEAVDDPTVWERKMHEISPKHQDGIRQHVHVGIALLHRYEARSGRDLPTVVHDIVALHHEKLDGSGKPFGLSAEAIPPVVRLATVIDQILSRVEDRPYHDQSYSLRQAYEEVRAGSPALYDETILGNLKSIFEENQHLRYPDLQWLGVW
ncbi:HD domain-containing protein [Candidatus Gottesmanbacteria bacterium]|nr:HD domain-containing protein [Candidatus Gottesmanbacteria bacterium]